MSATSGNAGYPVAYVVSATTNIGQRVGYVYVSGHVHTVTQDGYEAEVSPTEITAEKDGKTGTITLDSPGRYAWDARPNNDWLSITPTHGVASGTLTYQVAPYNEVSTRSGSFTVGGKTVNVLQYGRRMKLSQYSSSHDYFAHTIALTVNALAITTWSVTPNASWISVVDAGNGKGGDTVGLAIGENPSWKARTGTVTIGTETYTITQEGRTALEFKLNPTAATASVTGGNGLFNVIATPDLPWTAQSQANWLTVLGNYVNGAGNGNIVYNASPNSTLSQRTGTIKVTPGDSALNAKTITVTQPAATSSLDKSGYEFEAAGESVAVTVTVNDIVEWSISESLDWITVSGSTSRVGPGSVTISASANNTIYPRSGTVRIAGKTFSVSQKARGVEVEYDSKVFGTDGGMASVAVHPDGNVPWTAEASDSWIIIFQNASSSSDAEIQYILAPYDGDGSPRTGWITINDKKVYITQRAYDLDITPRAAQVSGNNGAGEIGVSAGINDVWQAIICNTDWITIVTGYDAGTGSGTVRFTYTENNTGKTRTGKILIAGEEYTLTQAARIPVSVATSVEGHGGTVSGGGEYTLGDTVTITATADSGYEFLYWTGSAGETMQNPLRVTADVAKSFTAHFGPLTPEFTTVATSTEGVTLTWRALAWATQYKIYRAPTSEFPTVALVTLQASAGNTYKDTTGEVGQSYFYWVEAIGADDTTECKDAASGMKEAPIVYSDITYTNLKGATHSNPATYQEGTLVSFTAPSAVAGYTFTGWTPSAITAQMKGAQAVQANWTANSYTIAYNANGGTGTMAGTSATYDADVTLAANAFTRSGYTFVGWATEAAARPESSPYQAGDVVRNLTALQNGVVTLYAVWGEVATPPASEFTPPTWTPVTQEDTLALYAVVYDRKTGAYLEAEGSQLAAFTPEGECRGVTTVINGPRGKIYQLSVGVASATEKGFVIKYWNPSTGETIELRETIDSNVDKQIGTIIAPHEFVIGGAEQTVTLAQGWNWISTYVTLEENDVGTAFGDYEFADGDMVKSVSGFATYYDGSWYPESFTIEPAAAYMVKKSAGGEESVSWEGEVATGPITVKAGWNWFGIPLASAATDQLEHSDEFIDGDMIKSSKSFATYYDGAWYPDTFALEAGVGYKAKLARAGELTVNEAETTSLLSVARPKALAAVPLAASAAPDWEQVTQEDTMAVYVRVKDADGNDLVADGSMLAAFTAGGECRGVTTVIQGPTVKLYQLSVGVASETESGFVLKFWNAATGEILTATETIDSNADKQLGQLWAPIEIVVQAEAEEPTGNIPVADFGLTFNAKSMAADIGTAPTTWMVGGSELTAANYVESKNGFALDLGTCVSNVQVMASKNTGDTATMIPSGKSFAISYFGTIGDVGRSVIWNLRYYSDCQGLSFQHGSTAGELQLRWMKSKSSFETAVVMTNGVATADFTVPHHYLVQVATDGSVMLYVDGAKVYSAVNAARNFTEKSYGGFALGRAYGANDLTAFKYGNGVVDDFRVFTSSEAQCLTDEQVAALSASFARDVEESAQPTIADDPGATVTGDAENGFVITPSAETTAVEVTIPAGIDAAKVTVKVAPTVESVTPNGATVKVIRGTADITAYLDLPAAVDGVINLADATVKAAIAAEPLDTTKGAVIDLVSGSQGTASPTLKTAPTRPGLTYTLREGTTLGGMADGATKVGDGQPWTPTVTVKGGASGFYSIKVGK